MDKSEIYALFQRRGIPYEVCEHAPVFTMEELDALKLPHMEQVVKNLFLRDDKKKNYYLVTVPGHKTVNLKKLSERIPSRKLSFAGEETLWELLQLKPGHVTPLGVLNNVRRNVTVVFDGSLRGQRIGVHPMENTATVFLAFEEVLKLAQEHGNPVVLCDFD